MNLRTENGTFQTENEDICSLTERFDSVVIPVVTIC